MNIKINIFAINKEQESIFHMILPWVHNKFHNWNNILDPIRDMSCMGKYKG